MQTLELLWACGIYYITTEMETHTVQRVLEKLLLPNRLLLLFQW